MSDGNIDGYKAEMPLVIASGGTDYLVIVRSFDAPALPGGFYDVGDDIPAAGEALTEALRELYADRVIGEHNIPCTFDFIASMPDDLVRSMLAEVQSIMGEFVPMEMSKRDVDARLAMNGVRCDRREMIEETILCIGKGERLDFPIMPRERPYHGAPRSIRETRRAQGRGKQGHAMRGWKRK